MISIIVAVIFLAIFLVTPLIARIILFILNAFIPDPIPYVDECIMAGNIVHNLVRLDRIISFIKEYTFLALSIFIGALVLIFKYL